MAAMDVTGNTVLRGADVDAREAQPLVNARQNHAEHAARHALRNLGVSSIAMGVSGKRDEDVWVWENLVPLECR